MAQSVFANPRPRYHKTDDPLADLAAITGFRSEGDPRSVDDFALDLEQELLGAFGGQEEAEVASERSLDADLDAGFATEFAAAPHDHLVDDFEAAFDAEFDAAGIEPANSNAQPAGEWEDFPLDDEVAYEAVAAGPQQEASAQPFGSVFDAPAEAEALVDLDFSDFDPADFEVAAAPEGAAAPVDAEPDFEAELFARIESEPAGPPVSGVPPQSNHDFEAELSAALGFADEPAPPSRPAPAAAPAAPPPAAVAPAPSDPFAELAALAASYKAVRPSVFARAPNWTLRRDEPAAVQPAVAPIAAAPLSAFEPVAAPVEEPVADDFAIEAADYAAEATYEPVDYVEEAVPATDEFDLPDFEFAAENAPEAWSDIAIDYEPQPVAPAAAQPEAEPEFDAVEGEFSDFFGIELERLQREEREAAAAAAVAARPLEAAAARSLEEELAIAPARLAPQPANRRGLFLAGGVAAVALLGGIAAFAFMGGDAVPSQPAVIKADTDPVKVKPANPGGAEIANQDKAVYDEVAGAEASGKTKQTALVSTSEEPVDVNAAAAERAPAAKSEDRVAAAPQDGETAAGGVAAVQPKKVRTLVVKPDGTLVAPEAAAEPAPVAVAPAAEAPAAEKPSGSGVAYQPPGAGLAAEEAPAAEEPVEVASAAPEADPVKAAIAADPVEPQQPAVAEEDAAAKKAADAKAKKAAEAKAKAKAEAKAKAKAVQAAAAEATETPAAGGEWSIQIASQPSREGAQASYKALSGKFGSIIGGRGVAIVQAEIPNKGTFYRVRVPAGSKADANELCARYQAAGGSCFITR